MKRILITAAVFAATVAIPAFAADVGVSVSIGQPGFYGRLNVGDFPQPQVIYRQPVVVQRGAVSGPPIYLHVPPSHARHWSRHCGEYNACGERVYFVNDNWYNREYVPRYQERHDGRQDERGNERRGDQRGNSRNEHHGNNHEQGRDR